MQKSMVINMTIPSRTLKRQLLVVELKLATDIRNISQSQWLEKQQQGERDIPPHASRHDKTSVFDFFSCEDCQCIHPMKFVRDHTDMYKSELRRNCYIATAEL